MLAMLFGILKVRLLFSVTATLHCSVSNLPYIGKNTNRSTKILKPIVSIFTNGLAPSIPKFLASKSMIASKIHLAKLGLKNILITG
jgi:hypothetical protein